MKTISISVFMLTWCYLGIAQETTKILIDSSSSKSMTMTELPDTVVKNEAKAKELEEWNKAMRAYYYHRKEQFEMLPASNKDIIFLGNSITDQCEWHELFNNMNVKNRGIGGDDTDGILERLGDITKSKPNKIFIMIGTNDLAYSKTINHIVENYRKIIQSIRDSSPETKIYIQSILPTNDEIHTLRKNSDIMLVNQQLEQISKEYSLTYIDLFSLFKTDNNKLNPEYSLDGLHLNGKGYMVWKNAILKYVEE
ncbi:MAG TPA: GDSL-type esterase/lipase family protein [Tenuifilaceae bacterium]|nr:GDSL-type esterase/lipase family protein [Tenuifilaceae bacterium]